MQAKNSVILTSTAAREQSAQGEARSGEPVNQTCGEAAPIRTGSPALRAEDDNRFNDGVNDAA